MRRHHERHARCEAVCHQNDREQRARDEGSADGPRNGEIPRAGAHAGPAEPRCQNQAVLGRFTEMSTMRKNNNTRHTYIYVSVAYVQTKRETSAAWYLRR